MKEQFPDTWDINQRMNLLLVNNTSDSGMQQQWIHNVRMQWLEVYARDIFLNTKYETKKSQSTKN